MYMRTALALLVVGIILLLIGLGSFDSIQNAFSRLFHGHLNDGTMWLIVGGCVLFLVGLFGCYRVMRPRA